MTDNSYDPVAIRAEMTRLQTTIAEAEIFSELLYNSEVEIQQALLALAGVLSVTIKWAQRHTHTWIPTITVTIVSGEILETTAI